MAWSRWRAAGLGLVERSGQQPVGLLDGGADATGAFEHRLAFGQPTGQECSHASAALDEEPIPGQPGGCGQLPVSLQRPVDAGHVAESELVDELSHRRLEIAVGDA